MFNTPFTFIIKEQEEEEGPIKKEYTIKDQHGNKAGKVYLSWGEETIDSNSIELLDIDIGEGHKPLYVASTVINQIFMNMPDVQRIYTMCDKKTAPFWRKLDFRHIRDGHFFRDRAR